VPRVRWRDPRLWLGFGVTLAAIAFALRGVDLEAVGREFRRANLAWLVLPSLPAYVAVIALRGLRWRELTNAIRPLPPLALCRATAIGFLANNVLPLRVGELIRSFVLARECRVAPAAVIGTVVIERVIDSWTVLCMALGSLWLAGDAGGAWQRGVAWLVPLAFVPVLLLAALRFAPQGVRRALGVPLRFFPGSAEQFVLTQLDRVGEGLGALRGGSHLIRIALYSIGIWGVASTVPVLAGFWSLGLAFPSRLDELAAGWVTLAALAIAVALPSAPGFFGVYHSACRLVLERFGFSAETAVATGTLLHAVFWLTTSGLGLLALRGLHTRLRDLAPGAAPAGAPDRP
jgi:glycosyltransferase 2 family protein